MSMINRTGLILIAEALGRARHALTSKFGDVTQNPGTILEFESVLARLRGSTDFNNIDEMSQLLTINATDPIGLGIQSVLLESKQPQAAPFPVLSGMETWSPAFYGPPCPEGWGIWQYNAWAGYIPKDSEGNSYYTVNSSEPPMGNSGHNRLSYNYPVAYQGGNYIRTPLYQRSRWISIYNSSGSTIEASPGACVQFTIPKKDLEGIRLTDHMTDLPMDVRCYSHAYLVQAKESNTWVPLVSTPTQFTALEVLGFSISQDTNSNNWLVTINTPQTSGFEWLNDTYWHVVIYWGSVDAFPSANLNSGLSSYISTDSNNILWPIKNFFRTEVVDFLTWDNLGLISPSLQKLVANDRTHYSFYDGQYSNPINPTSYQLLNNWPAAELNGITNSLANYAPDIFRGFAIPVSLVVYTEGTNYDYAQATPEILVGPAIPPESIPVDWDSSPYFPPVPQDYLLLGRIVLYRAPGAIYGNVEGVSNGGGVVIDPDQETRTFVNILDLFSVGWMKQDLITYAQPPLGDPNLALYVLPRLLTFVKKLRSLSLTHATTQAAFATLVPASGTPESLAPNLYSLIDPTQQPSIVFRGLLKNPINRLLQNPDNAPIRALQFSEDARNVINDLSGYPPSTELMRLDADALYLTNQTLSEAVELEIYQEPSDQCSAIDPNSAGISVGQDYTFRLVLEDANQNKLTKDWYIMASKFYLSDYEYFQRVSLGLTTTGYFHQGTTAEQAAMAPGTLQSIPEWRLNGYAGIVPDLIMGSSRKLFTRVVSPPDQTQQTEAQFIQNLQNQGYTQDQINEAIFLFLENGGQFLVIDLNQYSNNFVSIRNAAISVATYFFSDVPYWVVNLNPYFGIPGTPFGGVGNIDNKPSVADVRADSFTIAQSGLSIGALETYGNQSVASSDPTLNITASGIDSFIYEDGIAIKISPTNLSSISEFSVSLKSLLYVGNTSGALLNQPSASLNAFLYSDSSGSHGVPNLLLAPGGSIPFSAIAPNTFADYHFSLNATFSAGQSYWIVIQPSEPTSGGVIALNSSNTPTTKMNYALGSLFNTSSPNTWVPQAGSPWIKTLASNNSVILAAPTTTSYDSPVIGQKLAVYLPSQASLQANVVVKLKFLPSVSNSTGILGNSNANLITATLYSDSGGAVGTLIPSTIFNSLKMNALTESYVEYTFTPSVSIPSGSAHWIVLSLGAVPIGGTIQIPKDAESLNVSAVESNNTWSIDSGKYGITFYLQSPEVLGAFNRNTSNITQYLPPPNDKRTVGVYKVDGYWSYSCNQVNPPTQLSIYPRAFYNDISSEWQYARFNNDVFIVVKYVVGGQSRTAFHQFNKSPGWTALWWERTPQNFNVIDTSATAVFNQVITEINFNNYVPSVNTDYLNAQFEGNFIPLFAEQYTITVEANQGVRLYLDQVLVIDQWENLSQNTFTYLVPSAFVGGIAHNIIVQHNHTTGNEKLLVQWSSISQTLATISYLSAVDSAPTPILVDSDPIESLQYLAVGRKSSDLQTATCGAPPGDRLIIRST